MKTVLVTGIGGNVGQGILQNIRNTGYKIRIIGVNVEYLSAGNYLCDKVYKVPFSTDIEYLNVINDICKNEAVDLIIPSTDYESYYLAFITDYLVATSPANVTQTFLNKYKTWQKFSNLNIPFAESILPSNYDGRFNEIIVKPAEGRGSRNIFFNPENPKNFSDEYIVQPLYKGVEITTAFYVNQKKELHNFITFKRKLTNGATTYCEVSFEYDKNLVEILQKIISNFEIKGSCNLQSIVTDEGLIIPFEVNCRISGTNSIRNHFGFRDVKYTLDEYLYNKEPDKEQVIKGSAVRILKDIIYPNVILDEIKDNSTPHFIY